MDAKGSAWTEELKAKCIEIHQNDQNTHHENKVQPDDTIGFPSPHSPTSVFQVDGSSNNSYSIGNNNISSNEMEFRIAKRSGNLPEVAVIDDDHVVANPEPTVRSRECSEGDSGNDNVYDDNDDDNDEEDDDDDDNDDDNDGVDSTLHSCEPCYDDFSLGCSLSSKRSRFSASIPESPLPRTADVSLLLHGRSHHYEKDDDDEEPDGLCTSPQQETTSPKPTSPVSSTKTKNKSSRKDRNVIEADEKSQSSSLIATPKSKKKMKKKIAEIDIDDNDKDDDADRKSDIPKYIYIIKYDDIPIQFIMDEAKRKNIIHGDISIPDTTKSTESTKRTKKIKVRSRSVGAKRSTTAGTTTTGSSTAATDEPNKKDAVVATKNPKSSHAISINAALDISQRVRRNRSVGARSRKTKDEKGITTPATVAVESSPKDTIVVKNQKASNIAIDADLDVSQKLRRSRTSSVGARSRKMKDDTNTVASNIIHCALEKISMPRSLRNDAKDYNSHTMEESKRNEDQSRRGAVKRNGSADHVDDTEKIMRKNDDTTTSGERQRRRSRSKGRRILDTIHSSFQKQKSKKSINDDDEIVTYQYSDDDNDDDLRRQQDKTSTTKLSTNGSVHRRSVIV